MSRQEPPPDPGPDRFETTRWSLVLSARDRDDPEGRAALERLCAAYWYPLYAFVRRKGHDPEASADLVQGFFALLLERDDLRAVDPARGRFRSFLLAALSHYLANRRDHDRALKRGGGRAAISLDAAEAERRYGLEPAHRLTAERLYLRRWATTLLDLVLTRLADEQAEAGKAEAFEVLKPALLGDEDASPYRRLGERLGLSEAAARQAARRLRARFRDLLREEVGRTLSDPAEAEQELRDLFLALAG